MSDNQRQVYTTISARTEGAAGPGQAQSEPAAAGPTAREAQVIAMPDYPHGRGGMAAKPMPAASTLGTGSSDKTAPSTAARGMPPPQEMPPA